MSGTVVLQDCWCDLQAFHHTNAHRTGDPQLVHNFSTLFPQGAYWTYRQRLMYSAGDSRYIHIVKDLAVNIMTVIGPGNCERRRWKSPSLLKGHMTTTTTGENLPCAGSFRPPFAPPPASFWGGTGFCSGGACSRGARGVYKLGSRFFRVLSGRLGPRPPSESPRRGWKGPRRIRGTASASPRAAAGYHPGVGGGERERGASRRETRL